MRVGDRDLSDSPGRMVILLAFAVSSIEEQKILKDSYPLLPSADEALNGRVGPRVTATTSEEHPRIAS
jgi:hypothetical protein